MNGFTVQFNEDLTFCRVIDDDGRHLLVVSVSGDCPEQRRDRIARLVGDLVAECQQSDVVIAPFTGEGEPS